ncbi:MAG: serine/threonine protein kinase [Polyangiaceae bacterium]|nr:serine/threonine protein kinase [Polyangiaceae bacterium]
MGDPFGIAGTVQARFFRVEKAVAEGGFGVVYRAHHEVFRAPVALKCLKVPEAMSEKDRDAFLEKFRSEAELLFRLSAALPEIVRPLQFGVLDTPQFVPFMALEWLQGQTLDTLVRDKPLKLADAVELMTPVARALARAHHFTDSAATTTIAIIHRDMKPENVFVTTVDGERRVKILDFGIARVRADAGALAGKQTQGETLNAFSPAYAAPEQWHPESFGSTGPWTDVYGFALTMTQALCGFPPIQGDLTAMMGGALNPTWRPTPRNKGAKISDAAEAAFQRALSVDPQTRTQSIEAFWSQLESAMGKKPSLTQRRSAANLEEEVAKIPSLAPAPAPDLEFSPPQIPPPAPMPKLPLPEPSSMFDDADIPARFDIDVKRSAPTRPRPARYEPPAGPYIPPGPTVSLGDRFRGPAWLAFIAIAIGVADGVMTRSGDVVSFGPVRLLWIAGGLGGLAVLLAILRAIDD